MPPTVRTPFRPERHALPLGLLWHITSDLPPGFEGERSFTLRNRHRPVRHALPLGLLWNITSDAPIQDNSDTGLRFVARTIYQPENHVVSLGNMMTTAHDQSVPGTIRGRRVGRRRGLGAREV